MTRTAVACSDKFRGTLSAVEATSAMARGLRAAAFDDVREVPLADGGDGTLDVMLAARGGVRRVAMVTGPLGDRVRAEWGLLPDGTAVIEMARASGLALLGKGSNDPLVASTRGTGELVAAAFREGARRAVVGVGGSASTDGGLGALDALGWSLAGKRVIVACDVVTPFLDAAAVFGPQKGASAAQVHLLARRLERLALEYGERCGRDVTSIEGGGSGGGLAGGLAAIGATLAPGFEVVADEVGLFEAFEGAELVVTGEGKFDATSLEGKVVGSVIEAAGHAGVPRRCVIAGEVAKGVRDLVDEGVLVLALTDRVWQAGEAFSRATTLVEEAALEASRWAAGDDG